MSAMRSASSTTTASTAAPENAPRSIRSITRPGRGHGHVDAAIERAQLAVDRRAAVELRDAYSDCLAQRAQHVEHLAGELAGGHQARALAARGALRCPARAAAAGSPNASVLPEPVAALPQHVAAVERVADGRFLDREGQVDALGGQLGHQLGAQAEIAEGGHSSVSLLPGLDGYLDVG